MEKGIELMRANGSADEIIAALDNTDSVLHLMIFSKASVADMTDVNMGDVLTNDSMQTRFAVIAKSHRTRKNNVVVLEYTLLSVFNILKEKGLSPSTILVSTTDFETETDETSFIFMIKKLMLTNAIHGIESIVISQDEGPKVRLDI